MTAQQQHEVNVLVSNGWNYRSAIKYVLADTPPGHGGQYSKALSAELAKAVKTYERQHGIKAR